MNRLYPLYRIPVRYVIPDWAAAYTDRNHKAPFPVDHEHTADYPGLKHEPEYAANTEYRLGLC